MSNVPVSDGSTAASGSQLDTTMESSTAPVVTIVVLTWENYEETADCLDSLESISYDNYRVVVVDNGSEDGSAERIASEYDWCTVIQNDENIGFAPGNNVGISHALETETDYVLLLNDDTIVTEDFLDPLVETMERYDRVAAVGGLNLLPDSGEIHNAGYRFHPWLAAKGNLHREPVSDEPYPVDFVQSCLVLLNPEFLKEIGLLNENYFLGMEDVDLAWKARAKGWKVLVDPDSRIYHRVGETSTSSPFSVYHKVRNKCQFASENLSLPRRVPMYLSLMAYHIFLFAQWGLSGETGTIRAALLGVSDHLRDAEFREYDELSG